MTRAIRCTGGIRIQASDLEKKIPELGTVTDVEITERGPGRSGPEADALWDFGRKEDRGTERNPEYTGGFCFRDCQKRRKYPDGIFYFAKRLYFH